MRSCCHPCTPNSPSPAVPRGHTALLLLLRGPALEGRKEASGLPGRPRATQASGFRGRTPPASPPRAPLAPPHSGDGAGGLWSPLWRLRSPRPALPAAVGSGPGFVAAPRETGRDSITPGPRGAGTGSPPRRGVPSAPRTAPAGERFRSRTSDSGTWGRHRCRGNCIPPGWFGRPGAVPGVGRTGRLTSEARGPVGAQSG